jgi:hypothetical protein
MARNKCKHVFKQGQKAGKKCNKNCRGDYCKDHNKHRQQYDRTRIEAISKKRSEDIHPLLEQIRNASDRSELPDDIRIGMRLKACEDKARNMIRKVQAYKIAIGECTIEDFPEGKTGYSNDSRKIERYIKIWKNDDNGNELTEEQVKKKLERLMRKRDPLVAKLKLLKQISKECEDRIKEFRMNEEIIEDTLATIDKEVIEI